MNDDPLESLLRDLRQEPVPVPPCNPLSVRAEIARRQAVIAQTVSLTGVLRSAGEWLSEPRLIWASASVAIILTVGVVASVGASTSSSSSSAAEVALGLDIFRPRPLAHEN